MSVIKKNTKFFINKYIKKYNSIKNLLLNEESIITKDNKEEIETFNKSTKGFIYEKIWDICIKFGITEFTDINTEHGFGNINDKTKSSFHLFKDKFDTYMDSLYISGNSGGYSDITFIKYNNEKEKVLNLISVKYYENEKNIKEYDIQNLCTIIKDRANEYNNINVYLFVKNKKKLIDNIKRANKSSDILIKYISPYGNYENIYDESDLEIYYIKLKKLLELYNYFSYNDDMYENFKKEYLKTYKKLFIPRFHQDLFIEKINNLINKNNNKILVGAIPRSGKTYIMAGTILEYVKNNLGKLNKFIIITPAPTETISQYIEVFKDYINFDNNNIKAIEINKNIDKYDFDSVDHHTVYIVSKQRLGYNKIPDNNDYENIDDKKLKIIEKNIEKYFGNNSFDIIFIDEAHFGMSTKNAQNIINILDKNNVPKVFVTATYNKPNLMYNISDNQKIAWDINDIKMIKDLFINNDNLYNTEKIKNLLIRFKKNFGVNILNKVLKKYGWIKKIEGITNEISFNKKIIKNIANQYNNYPEPFLITSVWDKNFLDAERLKIDNNDFSFDMDKLFTPKKDTNDKFENEEQLKELLHYYFGYPNKDKKYNEQLFYKQRGILPRISNICNNNCRTLQSPSHKTSQLWFLPYGQGREIKNVINGLLYLLSKDFINIFNKYSFYIAIEKNIDKAFISDNVIYMSDAKNIKNEIKEVENKLQNKEGLIILAGARLQLGISLSNVDIVTLFTNITSSDAIYQMMFRSMTEIDKNIDCDSMSFCGQKKYGFMVDLNPQRTLITINYLADEVIDKSKNINKKNVYSIIADLINIDRDILISKYDDIKGVNKKFSDELFDKLYIAWDSKVENLKKIVKELDYDITILNKIKNEDDIRKIFKLTKEKKTKNEIVNPDNEIKGKKIRIDQLFKNIKKDKKDKELNVKDLLDNIITEVISLLTIITTYNELECKLKECVLNNKNIDKIDIKYNINKLLEFIEKDDILKDIFINGLKDRIINKGIIDDDMLFNFIKNIVNIINDKKQDGGNIISLNKIILSRKKQIYNINQPDKLLEFIHNNLAPKEIEKKERGEVFTPMKLVNEMLDKLPKSVWTKKDYKWLDPAVGIGNFPIAIYMRLMVSLKDILPNEEERKKHILENMLYMVEINKTNVYLLKKILCGTNYKLNVFEGSFLETNEKNVKIYKPSFNFDVIVGNPPYNSGGSTGNIIWDDFIRHSIIILKTNGYLLFVTPPLWRKPQGDRSKTDDLYNIMTKDNKMLYLEIHNLDDGKKTFNAGTRYDIYLIKKQKANNNIIKIKDEKGEINMIQSNEWIFIPNYNFKIIKNLLVKKNNKTTELLYNRENDKDKKYISTIKDNIYKYPIIYTTPNKGTEYIYSSKNDKKSFFGIPKVIIGETGFNKAIIDLKGEYGTSQLSLGIKINNKLHGMLLAQALNTSLFKDIISGSLLYSQYRINRNIFKYFKEDFYLDILDYKKYKSPINNKSLSLTHKKDKFKKTRSNSIGGKVNYSNVNLFKNI